MQFYVWFSLLFVNTLSISILYSIYLKKTSNTLLQHQLHLYFPPYCLKYLNEYFSGMSMSHKVICNEFFERKHSFPSHNHQLYIRKHSATAFMCQLMKIKLLYLLPFWQYLPKYPGLQVHFHLWPTLTQVPPFWHPLKTHATARSI